MSRFLLPSSTPKPHGQWISSEVLATFAAAGTNAHRLYSSEEGWVERFGEDLLLSYKSDPVREAILAELPAWMETHGLAWRRIFGKLLPLQNAERVAPVLLEGDAGLSLETVVEENGMKFGLDFAAGYSAGLFIDQRVNRAFLRRSGARRFLNTFAYTCSFSVAAALSGAETTSVDLSKKSIDRGRANFLLNGIEPAAPHRFYADDVMEVLPRLARKKEQFDAIVLDPPTFSRGNKGRRFQVERDFEELLLAALELAAPKARVLLSTNCTRMNRRTLEAIARFCIKATRRSGAFHYEPPLPDLPSQFGAQTLWIC
ncbi:MAG: class I SAM-dependent methyltransferase [Verrucomicrobiota bacterium]